MERMGDPQGHICDAGLYLGLCVVAAPASADDPCAASVVSDAPPSLSLSLSAPSDDAAGSAAAPPLSSARSGGAARKKLRLTREQSAMLEERFKENSSLTPKQKQALAKQLNLRPRQVEVWFQNRRARNKLKQTEEDRGVLREYFEMLTNENQKLRKELQELKALKFSSNSSPPPLFVEIPAAALAMCPDCERMTRAGAGPSMVLKSG